MQFEDRVKNARKRAALFAALAVVLTQAVTLGLIYGVIFNAIMLTDTQRIIVLVCSEVAVILTSTLMWGISGMRQPNLDLTLRDLGPIGKEIAGRQLSAEAEQERKDNGKKA